MAQAAFKGVPSFTSIFFPLAVSMVICRLLELPLLLLLDVLHVDLTMVLMLVLVKAFVMRRVPKMARSERSFVMVAKVFVVEWRPYQR